MTVHFTINDFTRAIEKAVADKGEEYTYPRAIFRYVNRAKEGVTRCIIGEALHILGVDDEVMETVNSYEAMDAIEELTHQGVIEPNMDGKEESRFLTAITMAQMIQDQHEPWGKALNEYKENTSE